MHRCICWSSPRMSQRQKVARACRPCQLVRPSTGFCPQGVEVKKHLFRVCSSHSATSHRCPQLSCFGNSFVVLPATYAPCLFCFALRTGDAWTCFSSQAWMHWFHPHGASFSYVISTTLVASLQYGSQLSATPLHPITGFAGHEPVIFRKSLESCRRAYFERPQPLCPNLSLRHPRPFSRCLLNLRSRKSRLRSGSG